MTFNTSTRLRTAQLPTLTQPAAGGITQLELPKIGILKAVRLAIRGTSTGAVNGVGTGATYGRWAHINRVRLSINGGYEIVNVTGPGYGYLLAEMLDSFLGDPLIDTNGRSLPAINANVLDMYLPVQINARDELGLIMLQNEQTVATLEITWAANAAVDGGAAYAGNLVCTPTIEYYEVPGDPKNWPMFNTIHQCLEDTQVIAGAGDVTYQWPRGNTYGGVYHLVVTTTFTVARLRVQQGNIVYDETPNSLALPYALNTGKSAVLAAPSVITGNNHRIFWDLLGSDGMGAFGSIRDVIASRNLTDLASVITVAGAGTLHSLKRQVINMGGAAGGG